MTGRRKPGEGPPSKGKISVPKKTTKKPSQALPGDRNVGISLELLDDPPKGLPKDYSPALMQALCDSIAGGLSVRHSLRLLGLRSAYSRWREAAKPYIDGLIARAESAFVARNLSKIDAASDKYWQAAAWLLERRYPSQFSIAGRGGKAGGQVVPVNVVVISSVPRPYGIMRRRGKRMGEPGMPPDEIEAVQAEIIDVVSSIPKRRLALKETEEEDPVEGVDDVE